MLPTYQRLDNNTKNRPIIRIAFGKLAVAVVSLPLGSFIFCVLWSVLYDFERATFTHCEVRNYLPSISAAIGNYEPQRTVWRLAICCHLPPRLLVARMYYNHYKETIRRNRRHFATLSCVLNVIENFALLSLSLWTSSDDYEIHRNSFCLFIATSEIYMLLTCLLNKSGRKLPLTQWEEKSLKHKRYLFLINVISFFLAGYCFLRHNSHCETGVYTLFAFFEYVVVLTNMAFHMTAYYDFIDLDVVYDWVNGFYMSRGNLR